MSDDRRDGNARNSPPREAGPSRTPGPQPSSNADPHPTIPLDDRSGDAPPRPRPETDRVRPTTRRETAPESREESPIPPTGTRRAAVAGEGGGDARPQDFTPGRPAAESQPAAPPDAEADRAEGAHGLGRGAERPGAVAAGFPETVASTGPAPETKAAGNEASRATAAGTTPVTPPPRGRRADHAADTGAAPMDARGDDMARGSAFRSAARWRVWGFAALAVLLLLWLFWPD